MRSVFKAASAWVVAAGLIVAAGVVVVGTRGAAAAEKAKKPAKPSGSEVPHGQKAPPGPALSPQEAMAKMALPPGFKIECVAAEPLIVNPTAFTFDDNGRMFVTESVEYPRQSAGEGKDRVKILEDTDGDGVFDKSTIFAEGLNIPCGVACRDGGVYVTNSPDVLYFEDRDGDGKADHKEVLFTGFGRSDTHELPNSLTWGPDGWLYGMNGVFNPAKIKDPASGAVREFTCAVWRYHPPTKRFEVYAEGTSNPWGLDYNRAGEWFISCCVIDHLFHITQSGYYYRQGGPYPPNVQVAKLPSISTDRHQAAAYGGLCIYDANVFPQEFQGRLIMGNLHGSALNMDVVTPSGSTFTQSNVKGDGGPLADGMGNLDFLQANDAWFMPVSQKIGPDGCLYVMDWYDRYHCYQDAKRDSPGIDRLKGRIYRISYGDAPHAKPIQLGALDSSQLVDLLAHPNVWWRRQAQRLLNERQDLKHANILDRIKAMALDDKQANNANMHALWLLASQAWKTADASPIDDAFLTQVLAHADPAVRGWGLRAIGESGRAAGAIYSRLQELAEKDPSPAVRVQAVVAAGRLTQGDPLPVLTAALRNAESAKDPLLPNLVYLNLLPLVEKRGQEVLSAVSAVPGVEQAFGQTTARWIKQAVANSGGGAEALARQTLEALQKGPDPKRTAELLSTLVDGLAQLPIESKAKAVPEALRSAVRDRMKKESRDVYLPAITIALWWQDQEAIDAAKEVIADEKMPVEARATLARTLADAKIPGLAPALASLAGDDNAPMRLRQIAVDGLASVGDTPSANAVVALYPKLPAEMKPIAVTALSQTLGGATALTNALEIGKVPTKDVTTHHARTIQALGNTTLTDRFSAVWGTIRTARDPKRVEVVEKYRKIVAAGTGDAKNGWKIFETRCAVCHTIYGKGGQVGPDLTGVGRDDVTAILTSVLDPNLVIGKPYLVNVAQLKDGDVVSGLLVEDSPQRVVLKDQTKQIVIERSNLQKLTVQEVSMMPEGLEAQMSDQEFRDLVAFLLTREPPR